MSIKCVWTVPTKYKSGRPAAPGAVVGYDLHMKVEGAPSYTSIATPGPEVLEYTIDVSDPGLYEFRIFAKASNGTVSEGGNGAVVIEDTSALEAPGLVVELV